MDTQLSRLNKIKIKCSNQNKCPSVSQFFEKVAAQTADSE